MTLDELKTWAQSQVYESQDQISRLIFKEVLPYVSSDVRFTSGFNQETGNYDIGYDNDVVSILPAQPSE